MNAVALKNLPWLDRIVLLTAGVIPVLTLCAPLGLAPLLLVVALLTLATGPRKRMLVAIPRGPMILSVMLLLWGLVSAIWAIEPTVSVYKFVQLFFLFAAGLVMLGAVQGGIQPETRHAALPILACSLAIVLSLLVIDPFLGAPLARVFHHYEDQGFNWLMTRHNRSAAVASVLLLPAAIATGRRYGWRVGAVAAVMGVVVLLVLHSRTAIVAAIAGGIVTLLAFRWRTLAQFMVALGVAATLFLSPLLPSIIPADTADAAAMREEAIRYNVFSFYHRLRIWEFVVDRIEERPVLGWGLDSSRSLPGGREMSDAAGERLSLHPHSAALQVRVELGMIGLLLTAVLVLWPVLFLRRYAGDGASAVLATVTTASIVASMSYGIWQSWWVAALWLFAMVALLACPPPAATN